MALWVAHEAWFADHLFYSPGEDYRYRFAEGVESLPVRLADGRLRVDGELREGDTLVLGIGVRAGWLGRFLEPSVLLEGGAEADAQAFERGVNGLRYLNLTGLAGPLGEAGFACAAGIAGWSANRPCGVRAIPTTVIGG